MKIAVITAALLLVGAVCPAWAGSDEEQLTTLLDEFLAGASVNDIATHERFWAEDLVYTSSRGLRFGKTDILEGMRAEPDSEAANPDVTYSAEDIRVRLYGEAAVVAFRLVGAPSDESEKVMQYFNTGTFVKREGRWQAVAWQATMIPGPD